jgi:hypothetical protein
LSLRFESNGGKVLPRATLPIDVRGVEYGTSAYPEVHPVHYAELDQRSLRYE